MVNGLLLFKKLLLLLLLLLLVAWNVALKLAELKNVAAICAARNEYNHANCIQELETNANVNTNVMDTSLAIVVKRCLLAMW